ncbi:MAG: radical SAM family heme chaperone HemW [Gilvibacter sp.]
MAGIYIHIPFCKQACNYCDFHFSTTRKHQQAMVEALCHELSLRASEVDSTVKTIYFGGGTPSLLTGTQLDLIFKSIFDHYLVEKNAEITLEANPDDLTIEYLKTLSARSFNRLSIGVQSFFEDHLQFMNRAHNATQAIESVKKAMQFFNNSSIDLIYGVPGMSISQWQENLQKAIDLGVSHLSCYALTIEPNTALANMISKGKVMPIDEDLAKEHYEYLLDFTARHGYINYEFSNFGKPGFFSKNNTAYWQGESYLGIGPGAHSYDGTTRSWNLANNIKYIKSLKEGKRPFTREQLSVQDRYNEYMMTGLRTMWGVSIDQVQQRFGHEYSDYLIEQSKELIEDALLKFTDGVLHVTKKGKFLSDGIAAQLFWV